MHSVRVQVPCDEIRAQIRGYSLSSVALGGGVEGGQFHIVEVLRAHLTENLLKGVELTV